MVLIQFLLLRTFTASCKCKVNVERNGTRWRDSTATVTMGEFRKRPEYRFTLEKRLGPIGRKTQAAPAGVL